MSKKTNQLIRQIANLDSADQLAILRSDDDELPELLKKLGIAIPASSWWLKVIKVLIYALGIFLAGVGTTASAMNLFL